jgi:anti-sigma factor RsiW
MSCEKFEELLARYAGGDLATDERRVVDEHLAACESCRESLTFYEALEGSLVSLRDERPSPARAAVAVSGRLGLLARPAYRPRWLSLPTVAGAALIALGLVLGFLLTNVSDLLTTVGEGASAGYSRAISELSAGLTRFAGSGEWVLLSVYLGIFALVMLTGSWMVLKFVRH